MPLADYEVVVIGLGFEVWANDGVEPQLEPRFDSERLRYGEPFIKY